jgi:hypothetical protein
VIGWAAAKLLFGGWMMRAGLDTGCQGLASSHNENHQNSVNSYQIAYPAGAWPWFLRLNACPSTPPHHQGRF